MRRVKVIAIAVLVIIVPLAVVVSAQQLREQKADKPAQGEQVRRPINQMDRIARQLRLTKEERGAVMPDIKEIVLLKTRGMARLLQNLRKLQRDKSASDEEITTALEKFQKDLADARAKLAEAEEHIINMPEITPRRRLILTVMGVLDNGTGLAPAILRSGQPRAGGRAGRPQQERKRPEQVQEK